MLSARPARSTAGLPGTAARARVDGAAGADELALAKWAALLLGYHLSTRRNFAKVQAADARLWPTK
jgi:hypothetical protein